MRDEIAAVVPARGDMRWLNDPNMELVASLTPCRLGNEHAARLGGTAHQCGIRIVLGFAPDTHARVIETLSFCDGERAFPDLRFQCGVDLFKAKELAAALDMPPPPARPQARSETPDSTGTDVEAVDAEDAYHQGTEILWKQDYSEQFVNGRHPTAEYSVLYKRMPKKDKKDGTPVCEMKRLANFAVSGVSQIFKPYSSSGSQECYMVMPISYRGTGSKIVLPASGISSEKDLQDILAKHDFRLQVAGFGGQDVSAFMLFLKDMITDDTPRVEVASHYGQNGVYYIFDDGWTASVLKLRAGDLKPWVDTATSEGLQLPAEYKPILDMDGHVPNAGNGPFLSLLNLQELLLFMNKACHETFGCALETTTRPIDSWSKLRECDHQVNAPGAC